MLCFAHFLGACGPWIHHSLRQHGRMPVTSCHPPASAWPNARPAYSFPAFLRQVQALFRRRRLVATFAVGFNVLFSLVGVFTSITFHLAAAPFRLSTAAGVVPGAFWALGKWPACVAFILAMQAAALDIALAGWRTPRPTQANL